MYLKIAIENLQKHYQPKYNSVTLLKYILLVAIETALEAHAIY